MDSDLSRAEEALHRRMASACAAAEAAGIPGSFRTWEADGLRVVLATDPGLRFLSTVSGIGPEPDAVLAAIRLAEAAAAAGSGPVLLLRDAPDERGTRLLRDAGYTRGADRALAIRRPAGDLPAARPTGGEAPEHVTVIEGPAAGEGTDADAFVRTLLAGYETEGVVAAFIAAEHRMRGVSRFVAAVDGTPIAAAAMTLHDDGAGLAGVALLGGASTLPAYRGRGAQTALLRRRLDVAATAGSTLAVATVRPASTSAANLVRAGFTLHRREAWHRP